MAKDKYIKKFGLVGKNIDYSFSRNYFTSKFKQENKKDYVYVNFDLENIDQFKKILKSKPLPMGLNVTIPYKKKVIPFLDELSYEADTIQAVNTIVWDANGKVVGHNTDHVGFEKALIKSIDKNPKKALILGTGGASSAVKFVLDKINCSFSFVSRNPKENQLSYDEVTKEILDKIDLIVNTTPLGTFPDVDEAPPIPYKYLSDKQFLFDLIYNPEETKFLEEGRIRGAKTSNGYQMLVYQAEKSWKLWNQ